MRRLASFQLIACKRATMISVSADKAPNDSQLAGVAVRRANTWRATAAIGESHWSVNSTISAP